jgi:predicted DNA-binding WGR domain protein
MTDELVTQAAPAGRGLGVAARWENVQTTRFYEATAQRNLFGDWEVLAVWGRIGSRRGGHQCRPVADDVCAAQLLHTISQQRARRGYVAAF